MTGVTMITFGCSACKHIIEVDDVARPEWFVSQIRPCPKCGTAMTVIREVIRHG